MDKARRQRPSKRGAILHYALKVFAQYGYGATTYDMIGEQAGVTRSLILKYYGSKENLAVQSIGAFLEDFGNRLAQVEAKEETYVAYIEKAARLYKRWRPELALLAGLTATPAHAHLAADALDTITRVPVRYAAEVSPGIVRQMAALHIAYAVDGDEAAFDARRDALLRLPKAAN